MIWSTILLLGGFIPAASTSLANLFGVGRGVDFAFYLSALAGWSLLLKLVQKQIKTSREITELTRSIAIWNGAQQLERKNHLSGP
jgi:hypothetical protein